MVAIWTHHLTNEAAPEIEWAPFNQMMAREREEAQQRNKKWHGHDFHDAKRKHHLYRFLSYLIVAALFGTAWLLPVPGSAPRARLTRSAY